MRKVLLAIAAAVLSHGLAGPAFAANDPPPEGSYLKSCKDVSFDASTGYLGAICQPIYERSGFEKALDSLGASAEFIVATGIDTRYCAAGSIWNGDGQLYCVAARPWGKDRAVPNGSYLESCRQPQVNGGVLTARCDDGHNGAKLSDLLVEQCRFDRDIWNRYGDLKCEPGSTPAQPLPLRLAPIGGGASQVQNVSPGALKALSGTATPLPPPAPSPSAAPPAESPSDSAPPPGSKKKRKGRERAPGERG